MSLLVSRSTHGLVKPSEPTPDVTLDLSVIDKLPVLKVYVRTLHVYRHGPGAARVIKEAMSKALVPYYPLAGRLKESDQGQLQVECSGQGVWFVEASAGCSLESVDYFDNALSVPWQNLLPDSVPEADVEGKEPLVQMQVTEFACGGFIIGLRFCHSLCDGLGAAQFLNAVGELARDLEHPTITPIWHRDFLPSSIQPPNIKLPPLPVPNYILQPANVDIPAHLIETIKKQFEDATGRHCSTFEVAAALFWKYRTAAAVAPDHDTEVRLCFFANCRHLVDPPIPQGFYGNAFFLVTIAASSESLATRSDFDVIKMIQEAKAGLPEEFAKYTKGDHLKEGNKDPFLPPPTFTTLFLSEWGRLGFNRVDYGWGAPVTVVPIQGSNVIPAGVIGSLPFPEKGIRLMTWCVEEAQRQRFVDLLMKGT